MELDNFLIEHTTLNDHERSKNCRDQQPLFLLDDKTLLRYFLASDLHA